jgi:hypothetical protein
MVLLAASLLSQERDSVPGAPTEEKEQEAIKRRVCVTCPNIAAVFGKPFASAPQCADYLSGVPYSAAEPPQNE